MTVTERTVSGVALLDLSGRLTEPSGNDVLVRVHALADAGRRDVVLNLAQVSYVDSGGLGTLVAALTALRQKGGTLLLLRPTAWTQQLLQMTGLGTVMESFESEASAIAHCLTRSTVTVVAPSA
jgi:anti-sigma B factor antagonist